jgi:mannose-6-phosphate isomerase
MTLIEPLKFERHFVEKVWGGRSLEAALGIVLPAGRTIGETWEIVDRAAENSRVAAGEWAGRTLGELMQLHAHELLGRAPAGKGGRFPLLVKYIDPAENLSVQVHPGDDAHGRVSGAEAKTEAWYIVAARPGSKLYVGLRPDVTREHFERVAAGPGVVDTLLAWDVRAGDCLLVPGGTVHAISAGVTILEVQQNSDTTYRLWDWGRAGRETHVEQALRVVRFGAGTQGPLRASWAAAAGLERAQLARSPHFAMDALRLRGRALRTTEEQFQIYAVLEGGGALRWRERTYALTRGDVWLIPACVGEHALEPHGALLVVNLRCLG